MAMDFGSRAAGQVVEPSEVAAKMGGAVLGRATRGAPIGGEERPSISQAIQAAFEANKRLGMHHDHMVGLAETAESIAHRLHGPYPTDAGNTSSRGEMAEREPLSSAEAVFRSVVDLHPRISALESPAQRIARALDAISRAIG